MNVEGGRATDSKCRGASSVIRDAPPRIERIAPEETEVELTMANSVCGIPD